MQVIQDGSYGGKILKTQDGEFCVMFLYNMNVKPDMIDSFSAGDVWDRKTYKSEKTAVRKIEKFIEDRKQGV